MFHSLLTNKGQTTIPIAVRSALNMRPGDTLEYSVQGDEVILRVHPGIRSLKGVLASDKGAGKTFAEIREAASIAVRRRER